MLSTKGFQGRVITTRATQDACEYMLRDSAHIQEQDADYLNYKTARAFLYEQSASGEKNKRFDNRKINKIKKIIEKEIGGMLTKKKYMEVIDNYKFN